MNKNRIFFNKNLRMSESFRNFAADFMYIITRTHEKQLK